MACPHLQQGVVQLHKKPYFLRFTQVSGHFTQGRFCLTGLSGILRLECYGGVCLPHTAEKEVPYETAKTVPPGSSGPAFRRNAAEPVRARMGGCRPVRQSVYDPLTLSAPGVDVVLRSEDGPAVNNDLTISACASAAITSTKERAQAVTGTASITSSGDVAITGADRAVGGETLTVDAGGSVTVTGGCAGASIWRSASITAAENVTITNTNVGGWAQGTQGIGKLTINAGGNVTITGGTASNSTLNSAYIACGGELDVRNPKDGSVLYGTDSTLYYANTGTKETVFRHDSYISVQEPGGYGVNCGNRSNSSWFTAKYEKSYPLTMTNCRVRTASGRNTDHFYKDETVDLLPVRPANATSFKYWTIKAADGSNVPFQTLNNGGVTFQMPACGAFATANYETVEDLSEPAMQITEEGGTSSVITPSTLKETPVEDITYDAVSNTFTVSCVSDDSQQFQGLALTSDALPNVAFQNAEFANLTVEGMRDVILGSSSVGDFQNQTGKILLTNVRNVQLADTHTNYFKVDDAQDVTITASDSLCGSIDLSCSGNVEITSIAADPAAFSLHCMISTQGNVTLKGAPSSTLSISAANHVTVDAPVLPQSSHIYCSGIVDITQHSVRSSVSELYYRQTEGQSYIVTLNGEPGDARSGQLNITDSEMRQLQTLLITPIVEPPVIDTDIDAGSASGGDIGGALAAVALGGAAVWGGYEAATRIILHKLLPEGAAIPKNQAELAVLLWNTAGQPEPVNTPAFADVDETTAKAAQWCTEQGLLDSSFAPAKRVTKYRVIRVWKQAFPTG